MKKIFFVFAFLIAITSCKKEVQVEQETKVTFDEIRKSIGKMAVGDMDEMISVVNNAKTNNTTFLNLNEGCDATGNGVVKYATAQISFLDAKNNTPGNVTKDVNNNAIIVYDNYLATGQVDLTVIPPVYLGCTLASNRTYDSVVLVINEAKIYLQNNY